MGGWEPPEQVDACRACTTHNRSMRAKIKGVVGGKMFYRVKWFYPREEEQMGASQGRPMRSRAALRAHKAEFCASARASLRTRTATPSAIMDMNM
jgi:CO/xanthine dehydrogenase Mo-binding subunit